MEITFSALERVRPLRCPYCHDAIGARDVQRACDGCQTALHADCLTELGRCPTAGCQGEVVVVTGDLCAWCFQTEGTRRSPELPAACEPCRVKFHSTLTYVCDVLGCENDVDGPRQHCATCVEAGVLTRLAWNHGPSLISFLVLAVVAWMLRALLG